MVLVTGSLASSRAAYASSGRTMYKLYYHDILFRGQFVRCLLELANEQYEQVPSAELYALKAQPPSQASQALFMAPPLLEDDGFFIAQTPAIVSYLARKCGMMPTDNHDIATADMVVNNGNDLIRELTCDCGAAMWTQDAFDAFVSDRFLRWLAIFEYTARQKAAGRTEPCYYLGNKEGPTYADSTLYAVFATMQAALPQLSPILRQHMPRVMSLCDRLGTNPNLVALAHRQGSLPYCGGQIEQSLRAVLNNSKYTTHASAA
ncbi:putative glutathione S-transferase gst-36 [Porphyridium purpureum]|uniref:Putative glutathione S-transferase gst-36 n=1 Tax=Porphyridium purpureum TaxID=35688 RepID=A0A5J4YZZ0_PORPP|nr:putative glutathione S-transferase gst-36 [Porphyridium purpureum]|eukprot:POR8674..scf208_2